MFTWSVSQQKPHETKKISMNQKTALQLPQWDYFSYSKTDARGAVLGEALTQDYGAKIRVPDAYGSQILNDAEQQYSATKRKCLNVM